MIAFAQNMKQLQRYYGLDLPLWNTEAGPSCNSIFDDCRNVVDNAVEAAASFYQGFIYMAALGVKTFGYYTWEGAALGKGGQALVLDDFVTPTLTGEALSNVRTWLVGAHLKIVRGAFDERVVVIEIRQGEKRGYIAWTNHGRVDLGYYLEAKIVAFARPEDSELRPALNGAVAVGPMPTLVIVER